MNFFVIGTIFAICYSVSAISDEQLQHGYEIAKECALSNGLTEEEGQTIRNDPKSNLNDKKAQKLIACILKEWKFVDDDGNFKEDIAVDVLSKGEERAKYEEITKQCRPTLNEHKDEMPIHLFACYTEHMQK